MLGCMVYVCTYVSEDACPHVCVYACMNAGMVALCMHVRMSVYLYAKMCMHISCISHVCE